MDKNQFYLRVVALRDVLPTSRLSLEEGSLNEPPVDRTTRSPVALGDWRNKECEPPNDVYHDIHVVHCA